MKCKYCGLEMDFSNTTGRGFDIGFCEKCEREIKEEKKPVIRNIDIVTASGVKSFSVGDRIERIEFTDICIEGDPVMHYVGFKNNKEVFRVSALCPVVVEFEEEETYESETAI